MISASIIKATKYPAALLGSICNFFVIVCSLCGFLFMIAFQNCGGAFFKRISDLVCISLIGKLDILTRT